MQTDTVKAIRDAFAAGEFTRAERWFLEYAGGVAEAVRSGTAHPAMLTEMRELIDWARLVVAAFRAQAIERLRSARVAGAYAGAYAPAAARPAASIRVSC